MHATILSPRLESHLEPQRDTRWIAALDFENPWALSVRAARDTRWIAALDFENPYALRMRVAHARELRVERPAQSDREFMEALPQ